MYKIWVRIRLINCGDKFELFPFIFSESNCQFIAFAGRLDHNPPERLTFLYLSIDHRINSGFKWSIYTGGMWSDCPAFVQYSEKN
jgi:hypothetical protein